MYDGRKMYVMYEPSFLIEHRCFRRSICIQQGPILFDQASGISGAMTVHEFRSQHQPHAETLTFSVLETTVDSAYASSQRFRRIS